MSDGLRDGFTGGLKLLGWVLGFVGPFVLAVVAVLLVVGLAYWGSGEIAHRVRVVHLRRQARRSGRGPTVAEQLRPLFEPPPRR